MKRSCRAALFAFLAFLVLATAAYAQGSSKTHFLIARPGMPDPNFRETVVLVTHEEGAEATGVIINRPTNRSLAEMLPSERFKPFKERYSSAGRWRLKACSPYSRLTSFPARL